MFLFLTNFQPCLSQNRHSPRDELGKENPALIPASKRQRIYYLVDLLLLIQRVLSRSRVDEQEETTNDGENLEEIVLGEVLVWVCVVELESCQ